MPLDGNSRTQFIEGLTADLLKSVPNPSAEVRDGMRDYATSMYERIVALVKESNLIDPNGNDTGIKLR
jgi:hypothetical protein